MDREQEVRLVIAAERMGTGLLRIGAALEQMVDAQKKAPRTRSSVHPAILISILAAIVAFDLAVVVHAVTLLW